MYAGALAIPAYPPKRNRSLLRIKNIIDDSDAKLVVTTDDIFPRIEKNFTKESWMQEISWDTHESIMSNKLEYKNYLPERDDIAFLQYTSGSTGAPKGVMVSHGNILANCQHISDIYALNKNSILIHWLPVFHDMGLVFGVLSPLFLNAYSVMMPPVNFIQKPVRWLRAIQKYKGSFAGAPDFAYTLMASQIKQEEKIGLDLSSLITFYSGAEPVRKNSFDAFYSSFKDYGLKETSLYPTYGMAETTLVISGDSIEKPPKYITIDKQSYQQNKVKILPLQAKNGLTLASVGKTRPDMQARIVNPETMMACKEGEVGEIWISGTSVTKGYWNKPELSLETFDAHIASSGEGPFLRTGDLGFMHEGDLYVSGRLKDLIIIRGANYYPQDIELVAEQSHEGINTGNSAAFSIESNDEEKLVIVAEMRRTALHKLDAEDVCAKIRNAVFQAFELRPHAIVLIRKVSIPKTSSGKIQRRACKQEYLDGKLSIVGQWQEEDFSVSDDANEEKTDMRAWLTNWIEKKMKIPAEKIDFEKAMSQYPFDSVTAIELEADLSEEFGFKMAPQDFFQAQVLGDILRMVEKEKQS